MKNLLKILACGILSLIQFSCANYLIRKNCEKVNWYQHGYDTAMQGKRLSGDEAVDRCRKAEFDLPEQQLDVGFKAGMSNYCKSDVVFQTGKQGDFINLDLCDPGQAQSLKRQHADGVKAYCAVSNGFNAGSSGKKYKNICPSEMEVGFMKEYRRGRKSFLSARLTTTESRIRSLDSTVMDLERERMNLSYQRNMLPPARQVTEKIYNSATGSYAEQSKTEDPSMNERNRLSREIDSVGDRIKSSRDTQESLRQQMAEDRSELATLD